MLLLWQWRGKSGRNCFNFVRGNPNGSNRRQKLVFSVEASQFRRDMRFWTIFWSKVLQIVAPSPDKVARPLHLIKISIQYKLMMWTPYWQDLKALPWRMFHNEKMRKKDVCMNLSWGAREVDVRNPVTCPLFFLQLWLCRRIMKLKFQLKFYKSQR